jgi:hypothetical protein
LDSARNYIDSFGTNCALYNAVKTYVEKLFKEVNSDWWKSTLNTCLHWFTISISFARSRDCIHFCCCTSTERLVSTHYATSCSFIFILALQLLSGKVCADNQRASYELPIWELNQSLTIMSKSWIGNMLLLTFDCDQKTCNIFI